MKRHVVTPRPNWQEKAEEVGFTYHTAGKMAPGDGTYWDESVAYEFSLAEVEEIEAATEEVHARCMDAADRIINDRPLMTSIGIPEFYHDYIQWSWACQDPTLYGRFDFAYDGKGPPKMLEYNADTPTMVIETALVQWFWLQSERYGADQFNSLHEKLLDRLKEIKPLMPLGEAFYFASHRDNEEEKQTCIYLQDLAKQAGYDSRWIGIEDIGILNGEFVDLDDRPVRYWFKLYPWEWLFTDGSADPAFAQQLVSVKSGIMEPIWKCVLSNKGLLPVLHEMFPDHPNILPCYWSADRFGRQAYVAKPLLSREGANIEMVVDGRIIAKTDGKYHGKKIFQQKADLFNQDGNFAVIGSWMVGNQAAGMIIRDHDREIVQDLSRVVPHWFT